MSATGYTPISLYYSSTASAVPLAANLVAGELALNTNDGKLYYKNSSNVVTLLAGATSGPAGGSNTQIQFNSSGVLAGSASLTWNGTTLSSSSITNTGLTSGRVVYSTTGGLETDSANLTWDGTTLGVVGRLYNGSASTFGASSWAMSLGNGGASANYFKADATYWQNAAGTQTMQLVGGTLTTANDASVNGLTVGRGAGAVSLNTAVGASALAATATGVRNTAIGASAGSAITSGQYNVFVGSYAGQATNTGNQNVAVGDVAMQNNTSGGLNTAVGMQALQNNTTGSGNQVLGTLALFTNTTGNSNTAIGQEALRSNTTASNNTAVGYQAGNGITTGSNNTYLGYQATQSGVAVTGEIVLCTASTTGKGSNTGYINTSGGVYQGNNSAAWSITSDQRIKKNIVDNNTGLDIINKIQVRNFEYRLPEEVTDVPQDQAIKKQGIQLGVIAQELQAVLPECVKTESTGVMTVDADNLTWYLVNAVKELSAQVAQLQSQLKGN